MYNIILSINFTLNILAIIIIILIIIIIILIILIIFFYKNHTVSVGYTTLWLKTQEALVTLLINQSSSEHVPSWFGCYGGGKSKL